MSIKLYVSFGSGFYCQMNEFKPYSQPRLELPNPTQRNYLGQQTALSNLCTPALSWTIYQVLWTISLLCAKDRAHPGRCAYSTDAFFWPCSLSDRQPLPLGDSIFTQQGLSNVPLTIIELNVLGLQLLTCRNQEVLDFFLLVCIWLHVFSMVSFFLTLLCSLATDGVATLKWVARVPSEMTEKLVSFFYFFYFSARCAFWTSPEIAEVTPNANFKTPLLARRNHCSL